MEGRANDLIDLSSLRSEGGSRPASRPTFFRKKVGKEPAPAAPVPPAAPAGNLRRQARAAVRPNSLRVLCTLRSDTRPQI